MTKYTTIKDFYDSLDDEPISKKEFDKKFLKPCSNENEIKDISLDSIKKAVKVINRSFFPNKKK